MAGNQARGLIISAQQKGWDPTKIPGAESILPNFDKDPGNYQAPGQDYVGRLPATPDGWKDGYDVSTGAPSVPWTAPDAGRENASRRTRGANPIPDMPGAGG